MTKPRQQLIALDATPYYHCVSRCVRRAFLCGKDHSTGASYEHRRQWIEDKILLLAGVFAIDICAYAVMSNHYHIVFHVNAEKASQWTTEEVIKRWHQLYKGNVLSQRFLREDLSIVEMDTLRETLEDWRTRLFSISQFMQILNESIARGANQEDDCTGRFWEGRYKSQALLDEAALAACLAYVDLNPIRAGMADNPETAEHTSAKRRIEKAEQAASPNHPNQQVKSLMPFAGNPRQHMPQGMPFKLTDYLELLEWTGRILRDDKRGVIPSHTPPIINRLNIDPQHWVYSCTHFESRFKGLVGRARRLKHVCESLGLSRSPGIHNCRTLLG